MMAHAPRWSGLQHPGRIARGVLGYLILASLLPVLAQALTLVVAGCLVLASSWIQSALLPHLPLDPVYASAGLYLVGDIDPHGLAISGPVGHALHQWLPAVFASESLVASGTVATAILEIGGTVVAGTLARLGAAIALLTVFQLIARFRRRAHWLPITLLLAQIHVLVDLAPDVGLHRSEIDAAGIPFLVASLLPVAEDGQRSFFTSQLDGVPESVVSMVSGILLTLIALGISVALTLILTSIVRAVARHRPGRSRLIIPTWKQGRSLLAQGTASASLVLLVTSSPFGAIADSETRVLEAPSIGSSSVTGAQPTSIVARTSRSDVRLERTESGFLLRVNGEPTVIKGVGYNPWYADQDPTTRRQLYDRDFQQIHAAGANMIEGWFESQFDTVTLDAANAHGLGVIMPFEMNQDYDYGDPAIQERFIQDLTAWVTRYRSHPAIRIWAPANEMMHRLLYPTLIRGATDPEQERRAADFTQFYVRVIDTVHTLDPDHPVLYRDAEDGYLDRLKIALAQDSVARPWFMYGANAYTPRISQIIRDWPGRGMNAPLMFSEFSPSGVVAADRPHRLKWFWSVIRSNPDLVLGGVVYTWCTGGPEDLDRVFGLTTPEGAPVDGSVAMLHRLFIDDQSVLPEVKES